MTNPSKDNVEGGSKDHESLGRPKSSSSRQQRYPDQAQQTGESQLDSESSKKPAPKPASSADTREHP